MYGAFASCGVPKGFKCVSIPTPTEKINTKSEENNNHTKTLDGKKSKIIIARVIGAILSAVLLFLTVLFLGGSFAELRYTIDPKTYDVTFDYSNSNWLILLTFLSFIAAIFIFSFLAFYHCSKKIRIIFTSMLLVVTIATCIGLSFMSIDNINSEISNDMHKIPKYTSMTLDEFLEDVNRYPDKWQEKEVTLEGRAINCKESVFTLKFPGTHWYYESYETIVVQYEWDESTPRIVTGDYVVVTAKVGVFLSDDGTYDAILYNASCEIKSEP